MFKLVINTENDAFESPACEIARILREIAARLDGADSHFATSEHGNVLPVKDENGNKCGAFAFALPRSEWADWGKPGDAAALVADFADYFADLESDITHARQVTEA